jgi:ATP-dependent RNA helicase DeaD
MPGIVQKLESMSKDDLIKNFVALEFNQLLQHYKGAEDINPGNDKDDRGYKVEGRDRGSYEERPSRRDDRRDGRSGREEGRDSGDRRKSRERVASESGFVRFYINIGKVQKVNPGRIIELLNSVRALRDARVGKILIEDQYSSVDIEAGFEDELVSGFRSKQIAGVPVNISQDKPSSSEKRRDSKRDEGKSFSRESKSFDKKGGGYGDKGKKKKW